MSEETHSKANRRGKKRAARGKLRKTQEIDHVHVEETFALNLPDHVAASSEDDRKAGEGCYVSATVHNRRYYGVLIDQASLKAASLLYFQDEASGLDLNRKMEYLTQQRQHDPTGGDTESAQGDQKRAAEADLQPDRNKRLRLDLIPDAFGSRSNVAVSVPQTSGVARQVQKFRYVTPGNNGGQPLQGYRLLLATYADVAAAAEDDPERSRLIESACQSGGNFVGDYFFQFELKSSTLQVSDTSEAEDGHALRMSMGFQSFLQSTLLPNWFPLSNLQVGQQKVLGLLNMKKDNNGNVVWDDTARPYVDSSIISSSDLIPMEPRSRYRVCVIGGGIAGLSCCLELFRICERERIDVEIVLVEGRSRLGGRLWTDRDTFKAKDRTTSFPVDLGASWIHGINLNPLAALAREAGVDFVSTSENVKMFQSGMVEVDSKKDEKAGQLFDKLLDLAANDCWTTEDSAEYSLNSQAAVRWYASVLDDSFHGRSRSASPASAPPPHRRSSDVSVDSVVGKAILKHKISEFAFLSDEERFMLTWNTKNVEYALGANIKDLSMRFWDIDERHAFEGDHVLLRQGYSTIVDHLHRLLKQRGDRFSCTLDFPVSTLEYNRKTTTQPYMNVQPRNRKFVELSDSCCVTSQDGLQSIKCDFVVSAVPLGVLKASTREDSKDLSIAFKPPLPFVKRDAIDAVGFGLLNKAYLQFPFAFWTREDILGPNQTQFGNASGVNPHHYMFLDIGRTLGPVNGPPAILMSLISGSEAAACEQMTQEAVVGEIMETLRTLFSKIDVPDPITFKVTRWGSDKFSRGSYTFLTPGTTDEDFEALQSPVNGNGDSLLLEGFETMRLFFAGEHTTALHPSMAHGAMLSGIRAAKEISDSMIVNLISIEDDCDRLIPMSMFRYMNPKRDVRCCMCHRPGTTIREGKLLAFKKGSRQILCHTNCAEYSPEVEVFEGKWKDVFMTVNRSRTLACFLCDRLGATIGCAHENCDRRYHFSCGEDTGWRFDVNGKEFYCDLHRSIERKDSCRISMQYFRSKVPNPEMLTCALCGAFGNSSELGKLLAFQRLSKAAAGQEELVVVHEKCVRYTSIIDIGEDSMSRIDKDFRNVFNAIDRAQTCASCGNAGATIRCSNHSCGLCYHFICAENLGWNFDKRGPTFRCSDHREGPSSSAVNAVVANHTLRQGLLSPGSPDKNLDEARSLGTNGPFKSMGVVVDISDDDSEDLPDIDDKNGTQETATLPADIPLALCTKLDGNRRGNVRLVRISRETVHDRWHVDLYATRTEGSAARVLTVASSVPDPFDQLLEGDVVRAINGIRVGSPELDSLHKVFAFLSQEIEAMLEIRRIHRQATQWY